MRECSGFSEEQSSPDPRLQRTPEVRNLQAVRSLARSPLARDDVAVDCQCIDPVRTLMKSDRFDRRSQCPFRSNDDVQS